MRSLKILSVSILVGELSLALVLSQKDFAIKQFNFPRERKQHDLALVL
jgi:hypothetical protein